MHLSMPAKAEARTFFRFDGIQALFQYATRYRNALPWEISLQQASVGPMSGTQIAFYQFSTTLLGKSVVGRLRLWAFDWVALQSAFAE